MKPTQNQYLRYYVPALLLATLALWLRVDHFDNIAARHLWAEDGPVFIHDAHSKGSPSLFQPYAGYLHLYPRLISLIANQVTLIYRPEILFSGWLFSYYIFVLASARMMRSAGSTPLHAGLTTFLISIQPHNGEVLFNITNAQWQLAIALTMFALCKPTTQSLGSTITIVLFTIISGLSGPFSIIILTCLIITGIPFRKPWKKNLPIYAAISASAAIQAYMISKSSRSSGAENQFTPFELETVTTGIWRFISLGAETTQDHWLAAVSLFIIFMTITRSWNKKNESTLAFCLFLIGVGTGVAAMYSLKSSDPLLATALGSGHRYTWIPYSLMIASASVFTINQRKSIKALLFVIVLAFSLSKLPETKQPSDLNFRSFARLSEITETVIPIHPVWDTYPGWSIRLPPLEKTSKSHRPRYSVHHVFPTKEEKKNRDESKPSSLIDSEPRSEHRIQTKINCHAARHIGIEIDMNHSEEGKIALFWSDNQNFSEKFSFDRWYPKGKVKAQFAFPGYPGEISLKLKTLPEHANTTLDGVRVYCLN